MNFQYIQQIIIKLINNSCIDIGYINTDIIKYIMILL